MVIYEYSKQMRLHKLTYKHGDATPVTCPALVPKEPYKNDLGTRKTAA